MLHNFQLAAIVKVGKGKQLFKIQLHQNLQIMLSETWSGFLYSFLNEIEEIEFDAGYKPEKHERFVFTKFEIPDWLNESSETIPDLHSIHEQEVNLEDIKGIAAFVKDDDSNELVLFQNFSNSQIIRPGNFLFLSSDTYETPKNPGLSLESTIRAVYFPIENKLLFQNYMKVNTFLPLADFYKEATDQQIEEVLNHDKLMPEAVEKTKSITNQWFRKRFAMLRESGILDQYDVNYIQQYSRNYNVNIQVDQGQIVFPAEKHQAKQVLQFLNEELYRGPITDTLYETNSKRQADNA